MFFVTYLRRALQGRTRRAIFTALGLAVGVGLVITVSAASSGVWNAQARLSRALYGIGTDVTVTTPCQPGIDYDVDGTCTRNHTDDTLALLRLLLIVLSDRNCASACDTFSGAVTDLHPGFPAGTGISGMVSRHAGVYMRTDNSFLSLPAQHEPDANHETINGIGVAPGYYLRSDRPGVHRPRS
jgi:hypothetical protein